MKTAPKLAEPAASVFDNGERAFLKRESQHWPSRRLFLHGMAALGLSSSLFPGMAGISWASVEELFNRIRGRLISSPKLPPEGERHLSGLPEGGAGISLETALNSRCTSDKDGDSKVFHWGMFDLFKKLRQEDVRHIVESARLPNMTGKGADILVSGSELTFRVEGAPKGFNRDRLMVESGMQQQAVCLACAALGAGMVFHGMGTEGTQTNDGYIATVRMEIDAMQPSYGGSFWTTDAPGEPWSQGNLPDPDRRGGRPLLKVLPGINPIHSGNGSVTDESLGQVLWAARGRTPHLYKSRHWGLTIPTAQGEQKISGVFLLRNQGLFEYRNHAKGRPTHAIEHLRDLPAEVNRKVRHEFNADAGLVVFVRNEEFARAFWEVGYQLLNAALQAAALGLGYRTILLDEAQRALVESAGIKAPVAAIALQ